MQSRAASGLRTSWPGAAVISRWKTFRLNIADAWSVTAAGSVTRTRSVDITVKARGVAPGVLGAGGGAAGLWQPASSSAAPATSGVSSRRARRSDERIGVVHERGQLVEPEVGQRGALDAARRRRDRHVVGHGDDERAGRVGRARARLAVLERDAATRVDGEQLARTLVRLRVRLAAGHLVAGDRDREAARREGRQGGVEDDAVRSR